MQEVLSAAQKVAEKSRFVRIDKRAPADFTEKLLEHGIDVPPWDSHYHFSGPPEEVLSYLLVVDTLNFCFWPERGKAKWEITYKGEKLSGYYAMAASIKSAMASDIPITRAEFLGDISLPQLKDILGGKGELQLMEERVRALNELGRLLLNDYGGNACGLVEESGRSAVKLARLLAQKLTSFGDVAEYAGCEVFFYKRAQIFASDLHGALMGKGLGAFNDMENLTCFADYKLPQVLRQLGILCYDPFLEQRINQKILLKQGSPEEVEIRANTVWAVELIRRGLETKGKCLRAYEIDWILWNMGQNKGFKVRPYHRTLTIFY